MDVPDRQRRFPARTAASPAIPEAVDTSEPESLQHTAHNGAASVPRMGEANSTSGSGVTAGLWDLAAKAPSAAKLPSAARVAAHHSETMPMKPSRQPQRHSTDGTADGAAGLQEELPAETRKQKPKLTVRQAIAFLAASPQIRCLAVMALAQGLSTNLVELAWKNHLHMLHPSPGAYSVRLSSASQPLKRSSGCHVL